MAMNLEGLTRAELEDIRAWVLQKREHYDALLKKIDRMVQGGSQEQLSLPGGSDNGSKLTTRDKVVQVMRSSGRWLNNGEIRSLLLKKLDLELSPNGLRAHLQKKEGVLFKRQGSNRQTKWKVIEQV